MLRATGFHAVGLLVKPRNDNTGVEIARDRVIVRLGIGTLIANILVVLNFGTVFLSFE